MLHAELLRSHEGLALSKSRRVVAEEILSQEFLELTHFLKIRNRTESLDVQAKTPSADYVLASQPLDQREALASRQSIKDFVRRSVVCFSSATTLQSFAWSVGEARLLTLMESIYCKNVCINLSRTSM